MRGVTSHDIDPEAYMERLANRATVIVLKLMFWGMYSYTLPGTVFVSLLGIPLLALAMQLHDPIATAVAALALQAYPFLVYIPLGASIGFINALPFLAVMRTATSQLVENPTNADAWLTLGMYIFLAAALAGIFNRVKEEIMIRQKYR